MDEKRQSQAEQLVSTLQLVLAPIAIAFRNDVSDEIPRFDGVVPAGCTFWERAAAQTFATTTGDHELCSIGVHTHNLLNASASQRDELKSTLQAMMGLDYVRDHEIEAIPVLTRESQYVLYGPLRDFPGEPDVVLVFAHAEDGLIISEAVQRVDRGTPPAMGRPACAVVPQVLNEGHAAMSLGCCGARAYLDVLSSDVALWAFPASRLDHYCEQITTFAAANRTLTVFHRRRRQDVGSGERPSVRQSLERVSPDH